MKITISSTGKTNKPELISNCSQCIMFPLQVTVNITFKKHEVTDVQATLQTDTNSVVTCGQQCVKGSIDGTKKCWLVELTVPGCPSR